MRVRVVGGPEDGTWVNVVELISMVCFRRPTIDPWHIGSNSYSKPLNRVSEYELRYQNNEPYYLFRGQR